MVNSQCLPCNATQTIQGKWNLWGKLHWTTSWTGWGRRGLWSWDYSWSQEWGWGYQYYIQWPGLSYFHHLIGTRTCIFWWWQNTGWLQTTPPPLIFLLSPSRHMFPYQQYNVDKELLDCLEIIYDLIDFLDNIRLVLETEKELTPIIHWPFNPVKTIGNSVWKSGPVSVFGLESLGPRPRPVLENPKLPKNRTGPV